MSIGISSSFDEPESLWASGVRYERDYYSAIGYCAERYSTMLHTFGYPKNDDDKHFKDAQLHEFIYETMEGVAKRLPLMKLNRWLGYIQGCMIERGYTTVEAERDWTRPLFRPLDFGEKQ